MKYQKFRLYKIIIAIVLATIIGSSITSGNYILPVIAVIAAIAVVFFLKAKVKDVLTDERIEKIGGSASKITLMITAVAMATTSFVFIALKGQYPQLLLPGYVLSYFACGMLLVYSIFFKYYYGRGE